MEAPVFEFDVDLRHTLLRGTGELDLGSCPELVASLALLESTTAEAVRVDFSDVTFVSCCCLRDLDQARRRLEARGRRLDLVGASAKFLAVATWAQYPQLSDVVGAPADRRHARLRDVPRRVPVTVATCLSRLRTDPPPPGARGLSRHGSQR